MCVRPSVGVHFGGAKLGLGVPRGDPTPQQTRPHTPKARISGPVATFDLQPSTSRPSTLDIPKVDARVPPRVVWVCVRPSVDVHFGGAKLGLGVPGGDPTPQRTRPTTRRARTSGPVATFDLQTFNLQTFRPSTAQACRLRPD